jgi:flagellar biosynthesis/type III secretory pathway chaperone
MSLPDLAAILWRQRELLERLVYRLECEQVLLASGRTRWLATATTEVEATVSDLQVLELQRASISQQCANELGLDPACTLEHLAAGVQPPWSGVLLEHRQALLQLTRELSVLAEANRHLMSAGLKAVEATLVSIGLKADLPTRGYDAHGKADDLVGAESAVVDRAL